MAAKDNEPVTAQVAKGRTVVVEAGTQTVGKGAFERKIVVPGKEVRHPERVTLPRSEAEELMRHGFLLKPDASIPDVALAGPRTLQVGASAPDKPEA